MSKKYDNVEISRVKRTIRASDGSPLLICSADKVSVSGMDGLNELYGRVCDNCLEYCEHTLYRQCQPPSLYAYKLSCKAHTQDGELTVELKATFTDRTARKIISSANYTHVWNKDGYLVRKRRKARSVRKISERKQSRQ